MARKDFEIIWSVILLLVSTTQQTVGSCGSSTSYCTQLILSGTAYQGVYQGAYVLLPTTNWTCYNTTQYPVYRHTKTGYYLYRRALNFWLIGPTVCGNSMSLKLTSNVCSPESSTVNMWVEFNGTGLVAVPSNFSITCRNSTAYPCSTVSLSGLPSYASSLQGLYTYISDLTCTSSRVYQQPNYGTNYLFVNTVDNTWTVSTGPCTLTGVVFVRDGAQWPEDITSTWNAYNGSAWSLISSIRLTCVDNAEITTPNPRTAVDCGSDLRTECLEGYDNQCIYKSWICDGIADCTYGEDELNCSNGCSSSQFTCVEFNGCIALSKRCNGQTDCNDGSDEWNCFKIKAYGNSDVLLVNTYGKYLPVCSAGWSQTVNDDVCYAMGFGSSFSSTTISSSSIAESSSGFFINSVPVVPASSLLLQTLSYNSSCSSGSAVVLNCQFNECGSRSRALSVEKAVMTNIIHGTVAQIGSWPWQVAVSYLNVSNNSTVNCGGSLIDPQWILTAAHCIVDRNNPQRFTVRLGSIYRQRTDVNAVTMSISMAIVHPNYNSTISYANDVALLHLSSPLNYNNDTIRPVCLEDPLNTYVYKQCYLAGWGRTSASVNVLPENLQQAKLAFLPDASCAAFEGYNNSINLCVGYNDYYLSPCVGDSGGPLVCLAATNTWIQRGIVSFGVSACNGPTAFVKIAAFKDFIQSYVPAAYTVPKTTQTPSSTLTSTVSNSVAISTTSAVTSDPVTNTTITTSSTTNAITQSLATITTLKTSESSSNANPSGQFTGTVLISSLTSTNATSAVPSNADASSTLTPLTTKETSSDPIKSASTGMTNNSTVSTPTVQSTPITHLTTRPSNFCASLHASCSVSILMFAFSYCVLTMF